MARSGEEVTVDVAFDNLDVNDMKSNKWAVSLGILEWKRNILLLMTFEVDEDGNWGWVSHGRIDALRRTVSGGSRLVLLMSSTTSGRWTRRNFLAGIHSVTSRMTLTA